MLRRAIRQMAKSVFTHRMMSTLFVSRRVKIEGPDRQAILEKQAHDTLRRANEKLM